MHRQSRDFLPQQADRPGIAHDHRVRAGCLSLPRRGGKPLQLVVEGIDIHRYVKPGVLPVGQPDGFPQPVPVKGARVGAQPVMLHAGVYGVRAEMQRRLQ